LCLRAGLQHRWRKGEFNLDPGAARFDERGAGHTAFGNSI